MAYIIKALEAADEQRNLLRIELADYELRQTDPAAAVKRDKRRKQQMKAGIIIPPGPWDSDLDNYPDQKYTFDLGDGYTGILERNACRGWNGFIFVPRSSWAHGCSASPNSVHIPFNISNFGVVWDSTSGEGLFKTSYGFCHSSINDELPYCEAKFTKENYYGATDAPNAQRQKYVNYEHAFLKLTDMKEHFSS